MENDPSNSSDVEISFIGEAGKIAAETMVKISSGMIKPNELPPGYFKPESGGIGVNVDEETFRLFSDV